MKPVFRTFLLSLLMFTLCLILPAAVSAQNGVLVIKKVTVPANSNLTFSGRIIGPLGSYSFNVRDQGTTSPFYVPPALYKITENAVAGWQVTSIACTSSIPGKVVPNSDAINLTARETITCTITNTATALGTINLNLVTQPAGETSPAFPFSLYSAGVYSISPFAAFSLPDASQPDANRRSFTVIQGSYFFQQRVPAGWAPNLAETGCTSSIPGKIQKDSNIQLEADEVVDCTFTFMKKASLVLDVVTLPSGDPQSFSFDLQGNRVYYLNLTDTAHPNQQVLDPGEYTINNTVPAFWQNYSAECESSIAGKTLTPPVLQIEPGETATCTYKFAKLINIDGRKYWGHQDFYGGSVDSSPIQFRCCASLLTARGTSSQSRELRR